MFQELKKRRAIHSCRRKLGPYLAKHYGKSENYTPAQVETGAQKLGLGSIDLRYGMAMYIARGDYNNYYDSPTQDSNYDSMRSEIADSGSDWFGGLLMLAVMIPAITADMILAVTMVVLMAVVTRRTKIAHAGSSEHEE